MTILFAVLSVLILIFIVIILFLKRSFKNPVKVHDKTPKQEGIQNCTEITIPTKNNKNLYGWFIKGKADKPVIIMIHGWGRNVGKMMPYIKHLYTKGYNILVFDSRNHGKSDTDNHSSMIKFTEDIIAAIDFIQKNNHLKNGLGLIGLSIGGSSSIYAAALDKRIDAVVTVGAFANAEDVIKLQFINKPLLKPFVNIILKLIEFKIKAKFKEIAPVNNITKAKANFLIIHGEKDNIVLVEQAKLLAQKGGGKVKLILFKNKSHSNCHFEKGFWKLIDNFFNKTIKPF